VNAVSDPAVVGLLIWSVADFVGTDAPMLNVELYAVPVAITGVIVGATIKSRKNPPTFCGKTIVVSPPADRVVAFVRDWGANVRPAASPRPSKYVWSRERPSPSNSKNLSTVTAVPQVVSFLAPNWLPSPELAIT
jgi:hypothetical protein